MHHILSGVFVDIKQSSEYMNGASSIQKILETWVRTLVMAQVMSLSSAFDMQIYFQALMFLKTCVSTKLGQLSETIILACDWDLRLRW